MKDKNNKMEIALRGLKISVEGIDINIRSKYNDSGKLHINEIHIDNIEYEADNYKIAANTINDVLVQIAEDVKYMLEHPSNAIRAKSKDNIKPKDSNVMYKINKLSDIALENIVYFYGDLNDIDRKKLMNNTPQVIKTWIYKRFRTNNKFAADVISYLDDLSIIENM